MTNGEFFNEYYYDSLLAESREINLDILKDAGKILHEIACDKVLT